MTNLTRVRDLAYVHTVATFDDREHPEGVELPSTAPLVSGASFGAFVRLPDSTFAWLSSTAVWDEDGHPWALVRRYRIDADAGGTPPPRPGDRRLNGGGELRITDAIESGLATLRGATHPDSPSGSASSRRNPDAAKRVADRDFPHRLSIACADPRWDFDQIEATAGISAPAPYRGFIRRTDADGIRYAYFGGRTATLRGDAHVTEGLLFEVSGRMKSEPERYPSDGRRFREIGEAMVTDRPGAARRTAQGVPPLTGGEDDPGTRIGRRRRANLCVCACTSPTTRSSPTSSRSSGTSAPLRRSSGS